MSACADNVAGSSVPGMAAFCDTTVSAIHVHNQVMSTYFNDTYMSMPCKEHAAIRGILIPLGASVASQSEYEGLMSWTTKTIMCPGVGTGR